MAITKVTDGVLTSQAGMPTTDGANDFLVGNSGTWAKSTLAATQALIGGKTQAAVFNTTTAGIASTNVVVATSTVPSWVAAGTDSGGFPCVDVLTSGTYLVVILSAASTINLYDRDTGANARTTVLLTASHLASGLAAGVIALTAGQALMPDLPSGSTSTKATLILVKLDNT